MAEFHYKARDASGAVKSGMVDAPSRSAAASQLRSRGLIVTGVKSLDVETKESVRFDLAAFLPVRSLDIELSLQQLSVMIKGGMPLVSALSGLVEQSSRQSMAGVWRKVIRNIQSGKSLSDSMRREKPFPEYVIQLVQVGERTGELAPVLQRAVGTMKARRKGIQEVGSALIYPVLVVLVAICVTLYMVLYLVPRLEVYLQSLGKDMPTMTKNLVLISSLARQYYPVAGIALCGMAVFLVVFLRNKEGRMAFDRFILMVPLIGRLLKTWETTTFARSLSVMLGSGITLIDGLGTVEKLLANRFIAKTVNLARSRIVQGDNFADAIGERNAFMPMLMKMVSVGQQSGDLKEVLRQVADFHQDQFESMVRRLNAIITPVLTIGIGVVVGYVYIAFFVALLAAGS